jgi:ATP-binding cassette subfamily B protein
VQAGEIEDLPEEFVERAPRRGARTDVDAAELTGSGDADD